jgi:hypothetical protein
MKSFATFCQSIGISTLLLLPPLAASAQVPDPNPNAQIPLGQGTPSEALPPPRSDHDPQPPVPAPTVPATGVTRQAGVGGTQAYGRAGVLELGGSAGLRSGSGNTIINFDPMVGLFIVDNVQLSGILGLSYANIEDGMGNSNSDTFFKLLVEPSFHLPFSETLFGFLGVGVGLAYAPSGGGDGEFGFALSPRLGANVLIGRSGILTPSLSVDYATTEVITTPGGQSLLGVSTAIGLNIGYTIMW